MVPAARGVPLDVQLLPQEWGERLQSKLFALRPNPRRWLGGRGQGPAPSFNPGRAAGDRASAQDLGHLGQALGSPELGEVSQDYLVGAVQNRGLL